MSDTCVYENRSSQDSWVTNIEANLDTCENVGEKDTSAISR